MMARRLMVYGAAALGAAAAGAIAVGCGGDAAAPSRSAPTAAEVIQDAKASVVRIDVSTCDSDGNGSGFIVGKGLVATAAHVVQGATSVNVTPEGGSEVGATVIGADPDRDVALLRADTPLAGRALEFSADAEPQVGADVVALGYPLGLPFTATKGAVTGLARDLTIESTDYQGLFQTDAAVNPGNSGGAIVDLHGRVVGIVVAGGDGYEGIGFGVPAANAKPALDTWAASPRPVPLEACGGAAEPPPDPSSSSADGAPDEAPEGASFESPTGNIRCFDSTTELFCTTANDGYAVALPSNDAPQAGYQGEALPGGAVLGYGSTWTAPSGNFECDMSEDGVTCRNYVGHGFFLNRDSYEPL